MYVHPIYAVTPERLPLGVIDAWMWAREKINAAAVRPGLRHGFTVKADEHWRAPIRAA
jgi:hypothetical protein